jgi:hypothetical protein
MKRELYNLTKVDLERLSVASQNFC